MKTKAPTILDDKTRVNPHIYKNANREAEKSIAVTRAVIYKDLYNKQDTRDAKENLYLLVKTRP